MDERIKAAVEAFAKQIKNYYNTVGGTTYGFLVAYHVEQKKNEFLSNLKKEEEDDREGFIPLP